MFHEKMLTLQQVLIFLPETELFSSARTPITIRLPHSSMSETGVRRTFTILNETIYICQSYVKGKAMLTILSHQGLILIYFTIHASALIR